MPKPLSSLADIPDPIKLRSGAFSAAYTKRLCRENARLQVERQVWQKEKIALTQAAIHDR